MWLTKDNFGLYEIWLKEPTWGIPIWHFPPGCTTTESRLCKFDKNSSDSLESFSGITLGNGEIIEIKDFKIKVKGEAKKGD